MKFVKQIVKRTKSFSASDVKLPTLRRTSSMGSRKSDPAIRRTKSLDPEEMKAGLDDSVEFFAMETPTIVSHEELQDVIEALALTKEGESDCADAPMDEATMKKQIAKVKEFWRLINAKKPEAAYRVISDDIQAIQKHWDVILPYIQKKTPSPLALQRMETLSGTTSPYREARVA